MHLGSESSNHRKETSIFILIADGLWTWSRKSSSMLTGSRKLALTSSEASLRRAFAAQTQRHHKSSSIATVNVFLAGKSETSVAAGKKYAENIVLQAVDMQVAANRQWFYWFLVILVIFSNGSRTRLATVTGQLSEKVNFQMRITKNH